MKHYYHKCPYNPDGDTHWSIHHTDCLWCLQDWICFYEYWYRKRPKFALAWIAEL